MSDTGANVKFLFDPQQPGADPGTTTADLGHDNSETAAVASGEIPAPGPPAPVPLERVEAQICELAGPLTAATGRFLVLLGDFDARRGWASWEMTSCAAWLSWKCQMSSGTAREHVRVARALRDLPVIRAEFGAGRLPYAKVRAPTPIATPAPQQGLAQIPPPLPATHPARSTHPTPPLRRARGRPAPRRRPPLRRRRAAGRPGAAGRGAPRPPATRPAGIRPPALRPPAIRPPAIRPPALRPPAIRPAAIRPAA